MMEDLGSDRRSFLKNVGGGLIAAGAVSAVAQDAAAAGHEAVTQTQETQAAITPQKALQMLKDGNARFVAGKPLKRDYLAQVKATSAGQFPFAAIVGCIDSRESATLTFDQGIGDVFAARIAGNFVNDDLLGSLEFACAAAGAKLILVVGHSECGAIKGACDDVVLGNLTQTLANLKPAVAAVSGFDSDRSSANAKFVQAVAEKNVELTVARIKQRSAILRDMAEKGDIGIEGAMYDVHTGKVMFM
ncbi:MAG: carbonic anhydrase family protein [Kiloniellales bacterium]|nr:carbonic anhydrase family protein [Kiloniellales bacterium]